MEVTRAWALSAAVAGLAVTAGCSNADTPSEADYDDVAQALGGLTATGDGGGEVGTMRDSVAIATGSSTEGIDIHGSGEVRGFRLGLMYEYAAACSDVDGRSLPACGEASDTAAIQVTWLGDLQTPILSASVSRDGELAIHGLTESTATVDGISDLEISARFDSLFRQASRSYELAYRAEYEDVQVQRSPLRVVGGRVRYTLSVDRVAVQRARESSAHFEIDAELAFQPSGAVLTLDGAFKYAVNLESGAVTKM